MRTSACCVVRTRIRLGLKVVTAGLYLAVQESSVALVSVVVVFWRGKSFGKQ